MRDIRQRKRLFKVERLVYTKTQNWEWMFGDVKSIQSGWNAECEVGLEMKLERSWIRGQIKKGLKVLVKEVQFYPEKWGNIEELVVEWWHQVYV